MDVGQNVKATTQTHLSSRGRTGLSVLASAFLCIFVLAGLLWILAADILSENGVRQFMERVDIAEASNGIIQTINRQMGQQSKSNFELNDDNLRALMQEDEISTFVSSQLAAYVEAMLVGDDNYVLPRDTLIAFLRDNGRLIERNTGYILTDAGLEELDTFLEENEEQFQAGTLLGNSVPEAVRFFLSVPAMIIIVLLGLLCGLYLYLLHKHHWQSMLMYGGAVLIVAGLLIILLGLLAEIVVGGNSDLQNALRGLVSIVADHAFTSGLWTLGAGALIAASYLALTATQKRLAYGPM